MEIISKSFKELEISFYFETDIYLNATETAKLFNKKPVDWLKTQETKDYILSLEQSIGLSKNQLIKIVKGGNDKHAQGTWIHKKLILFFARWLSSDFAIWCDLQIEQILSQQYSNQKSQTVQKPQTQNFQLPEIGNSTEQIIELKNDVLETSSLIEILESKKLTTLYRLEKFYRKFHDFSVLEYFEIELDSQFFLPTELGKMINKSAVEVNLMLAHKGFQVRENGVWKLTESGRDFGIEINGQFSQLKWKIKSIV